MAFQKPNNNFKPNIPRRPFGQRRPPRLSEKQQFRESFIINHKITAKELRVIGSDDKQIGIMSLEAALDNAKAQELDLVLIAPQANPPVARIVAFDKFAYLEEKKLAHQKKGAKKGVVKDIKISLFAGEADTDRWIHKAKEFLHEGSQVRINLNLKGRQAAKTDMAMQKMQEIITKIPEGVANAAPRLEGKVVRVVLSKKH